MASVSDLRTNVLLRSEQSGGHVSMMENIVSARSAGPPLHKHNFDEAFYMLEGELIFQVGQSDPPSARASSRSRRATSFTRSPTTATRRRAICSFARRPGSSASSRGSPPPRRASSHLTGR